MYHATVGTALNAEWLNTRWRLSHFGSQLRKARASYVDHLRAGVGLPSVWGDADFRNALQQRIRHHAFNVEVPRSQCRSAAPALNELTNLMDLNSAMVQACATGCYSMKGIGQAFGVHYCTV